MVGRKECREPWLHHILHRGHFLATYWSRHRQLWHQEDIAEVDYRCSSFGEVAEHVLEAINFANALKSAMAAACSAEGKKAAVEAAWEAQATAYAGLSEQAQGELYLGSYSTVDEIIEFAERYMAIKQQHPDWTLDNFLDWDIPNSPAFVPTSEQSSVSKNANILIIIVASVSVISLATLIVIKNNK